MYIIFYSFYKYDKKREPGAVLIRLFQTSEIYDSIIFPLLPCVLNFPKVVEAFYITYRFSVFFND